MERRAGPKREEAAWQGGSEDEEENIGEAAADQDSDVSWPSDSSSDSPSHSEESSAEEAKDEPAAQDKPSGTLAPRASSIS